VGLHSIAGTSPWRRPNIIVGITKNSSFVHILVGRFPTARTYPGAHRKLVPIFDPVYESE
jgi:hypothetical protein